MAGRLQFPCSRPALPVDLLTLFKTRCYTRLCDGTDGPGYPGALLKFTRAIPPPAREFVKLDFVPVEVLAISGLIDSVESQLLETAEWFYDKTGWFGIIILMALENAVAPLPSEIVMPLAGWKLILEQGLSIWYVVLAGFLGAIGNLIGSLIAYWVGMRGGRPLLNRYGKYLLISHRDLDRADRFFEKHGEVTVLVARLIPLVRGVISIPAGIARMDLWKFSIYSLVGALPWSIGLAYGGYKLGENWEELRGKLEPFEIPVMVILGLLVAWYIWHQVRELRAQSSRTEAETSVD